MHRLVPGLACVVLTLIVVGVTSSSTPPAFGELKLRPNARDQDGSLVAFDATSSEGLRQIVIIDSRKRAVSVYHVDGATGEISLRSVRNIQWDLELDEFSAGSPPIKEVRAMVEHR